SAFRRPSTSASSPARCRTKACPCHSSATAARTCWPCSRVWVCCSASPVMRPRGKRFGQRPRSLTKIHSPPKPHDFTRSRYALRRHRLRRHGRASVSGSGGGGTTSETRLRRGPAHFAQGRGPGSREIRARNGNLHAAGGRAAKPELFLLRRQFC